MRLLQTLPIIVWSLGYAGNGLLFLYVEWHYLRQSFSQLFNPFLHLQVVLTLLTMPLFWMFFGASVLGHFSTISIEKFCQKGHQDHQRRVMQDRSGYQSQSRLPPPVEPAFKKERVYSSPVISQNDNVIPSSISPTISTIQETTHAKLPVGKPLRPYIENSTERLEKLVIANWNDISVLRDIEQELAYRSRKKGKELYFKVVERLKILERNHFTWPHTTATTTNNSQSLVPDIFRSEEGLLSRLSYKVGASGLPEIQRRRILDQAFKEVLPMNVNDAKYLAEWGKPLTSARLQKIANSIAAFTRNAKRQKQSDFSQAIRDWEADLAYLKQHYYDGYFDFQWPYTNIRLRK